MKKRILVCAYFARNIGDDLFLKVLFDRYPEIEWDLLTANRHYNNIFKGYKNVKIIYSYRDIQIGKRSFNLFFKLNDVFLNLKKYDAFIHIGGSIFMQNKGWKMKMLERQYLVNEFKKMNKKTFIIGANFGPYKDDTFINEYKELFKKFDDICFRETYSYNLYKDLENVRVAPDVVFNLKVKKIKKEKEVGFSLINLENREGLKEYSKIYNEKMIQFVKRYIVNGYKIKLFSFCENEGDLEVCQNIMSKIEPNDKNSIRIINYEGNIEYFLHEFSSCETIIGSRFHSVILGMICNHNIFPIIYSEKTYNVLSDLHMSSNCCYVEDLELLEVDSVIEAIKNNKLRNLDIVKEANKQFAKMDQMIG